MQKNITSIAGKRKTNASPVKFLIILMMFFIMRANKTVKDGRPKVKQDDLVLFTLNTSSSSKGSSNT